MHMSKLMCKKHALQEAMQIEMCQESRPSINMRLHSIKPILFSE